MWSKNAGRSAVTAFPMISKEKSEVLRNFYEPFTSKETGGAVPTESPAARPEIAHRQRYRFARPASRVERNGVRYRGYRSMSDREPKRYRSNPRRARGSRAAGSAADIDRLSALSVKNKAPSKHAIITSL